MADRKTVRHPVERVNADGVKVDGTWHNYGRTFTGQRLTKDAVGKEYELSLVHSAKDGKWVIQAISPVKAASTAKSANGAAARAPVEPPAPEESEAGELQDDPAPEPSSDEDGRSASAEALKYAEDLALKEGWTSEELSDLAVKRFKKPFASLSPREASKLIEFFGGYALSPSAKAS